MSERIAPEGLKVATTSVVDQDNVALVARIRSCLPMQRVQMEMSSEFAEFGLPWTWEQLREKVHVTLPIRLFKRRHVRWTSLASFAGHIPDAALLRYHAADQSGAFDGFLVVWASYQQQPRSDPWLVGRVKGSSPFTLEGAPSFDTGQGLYVVLAYWD